MKYQKLIVITAIVCLVEVTNMSVPALADWEPTQKPPCPESYDVEPYYLNAFADHLENIGDFQDSTTKLVTYEKDWDSSLQASDFHQGDVIIWHAQALRSVLYTHRCFFKGWSWGICPAVRTTLRSRWGMTDAEAKAYLMDLAEDLTDALATATTVTGVTGRLPRSFVAHDSCTKAAWMTDTSDEFWTRQEGSCNYWFRAPAEKNGYAHVVGVAAEAIAIDIVDTECSGCRGQITSALRTDLDTIVENIATYLWDADWEPDETDWEGNSYEAFNMNIAGDPDWGGGYNALLQLLILRAASLVDWSTWGSRFEAKITAGYDDEWVDWTELLEQLVDFFGRDNLPFSYSEDNEFDLAAWSFSKMQKKICVYNDWDSYYTAIHNTIIDGYENLYGYHKHFRRIVPHAYMNVFDTADSGHLSYTLGDINSYTPSWPARTLDKNDYNEDGDRIYPRNCRRVSAMVEKESPSEYFATAPYEVDVHANQIGVMQRISTRIILGQ